MSEDVRAVNEEGALELEIDAAVLADYRARAERHLVLDVREPWETGICALDGSLKIPMGEIPARVQELPRDEILVVICHHGQRSLRVAAWLRGQGLARAASLAGGIDAWASAYDPGMARY